VSLQICNLVRKARSKQRSKHRVRHKIKFLSNKFRTVKIAKWGITRILGFRYRASSIDYKIKVSNRCNQLYIFIVYVTSQPTRFGPLLAHHQGCPGLLVYATIWFMQCCCMSVRPRQGHHPRTNGQTTALHEPNGNINKQPRTPLMMGQ
jgi:hypothetical protein